MTPAQLLERAARYSAQAKTATTEDIRTALERIAERYAALAVERQISQGGNGG
jgi:uncharacterized membrane protein